MDLTGKVAVVTGGGAGLGLAYGRELAARGSAVVVNDADTAAADRAVRTISTDGGHAVACGGPVGPTGTAEKLVRTALDEFGSFDVLVTNAGILRDRSLLKMTDEDFDTVIDVHLRGTFTCVREAFRHFKENGVAGRIVTIGSPTGMRGTFGQTNYAAAKAGIVGMVRTWALEMKRAGVDVNAVVPVAATAMTRTVPYFAAAVEADEAGEPMPEFFRRTLGFGPPEDAAGLVAFLASDAAAGITGQVLGVGGDRLQLWSHPEPVDRALREGGWTFDALVEQFPFRDRPQSVGEDMPPLPEELRRPAPGRS